MYQFLLGAGLTVFFAAYLALAIYLVWSERGYSQPSRTWLVSGVTGMILTAPIPLVAGLVGALGSSMMNTPRPAIPIGLYIAAGVIFALGVAGVVTNPILARSARIGEGGLIDVLASQLVMGESILLTVAGAWLVVSTFVLVGGISAPIAQPV